MKFCGISRCIFLMAGVVAHAAFGAGISVTAPGSNSLLAMATSYPVSWQYEGTTVPTTVMIRLYQGDAFDRPLASSVKDKTSYTWLVPEDLDTLATYRIRVHNADDSTQVGFSGTFKIRDSSLVVIAPVEGDAFSVNGPQMIIKWKLRGTFPNYDFELTLYSDTGKIETIASKCDGKNSLFSWSIPKTLDTLKTYRIKVASIAKPSCFNYSGQFTVNNRWDLQFASPDDSIAEKAGENVFIRWEVTFPADNIKLELYRRGFFLRTIAPSISKSNTVCNWILPNELETDSEYTIKASDVSDPSRFTMSGNFTINNVPEITLQNPGTCEEGNPCTVSWNGKGLLDTIGFSYSIDSGKTWVPFTTGTGVTGSVPWNSPLTNNLLSVQIRARCSNSAKTEDTVVFVIGTKVRLISPVNTVATAYRVPFSWHSLRGCQSYLLTVDTTTQFKAPVIVLSLTDTVYTPAADLSPRNYFWKVIPSGWTAFTSPITSFTIQNNQIPLAVTMQPAIINNRRPMLQWHPVSGSTGYTLTIATNTSFSPVVATVPLSDTSYTPATDLPIGTIYWKVRSSLLDQYCQIQSFVIQTAEAPLLYAFDSAMAPSGTPVFTWSKITGATSYSLEIVDSLNQQVISTSVNDTFYLPGTPLKKGLYRWRVSSSVNLSRFSEWDFVRIPLMTMLFASGITPAGSSVCLVNNQRGLSFDIMLSTPADVSMAMFTVNGKCVFNTMMRYSAGYHHVLPSGVLPASAYIVRILLGDQQFVKKISLVR